MKITIKYQDKINHIVLENETSMRVELSCFGASIYNLELLVDGRMRSMVLTPSNLSDFYTNTSYHGKTIGRFSGRIDKGCCQIDDKEYNLDINWNGVNSLHGGFEGLSSRVCDYQIIETATYTDVVFTYTETDKMLPGTVNYEIIYRVENNKNEITTFLNATTTENTLVNMTNHTYFNLSGDCEDTVLNHNLYLNCNKFTKLNNELITEEILDVNEIMDFRDNHEIGKYILDESLQNHTASGYDHCFIKEDNTTDVMAVLTNKNISLTVSSSYPAIVVYSGNYPDAFPFNKEGIVNQKYHSVCLEAQYVPNGINMSGVEKAILNKDEKYSHYIKYRFEIK